MLKPIKRAVHFDFHTMPGVDDFGENFDASLFARQMKDAHVEYINFFGRCNIGWSYYPTKVGYPYPGLNGKNILGDVVRECHKLGIQVTGYLNAGVHHEALLRHPEWSKVNMKGETVDLDPQKPFNGNFFRMPCYNTGYADHLLAEIRELLDLDVDGIFCDCMLLRPCLCPNCTKEMLARGMDLSDEKQVTDFAEEQRRKMIRRIRETVPEDKYLFINSLPCPLTKDVATHAELECLPTADGYDRFVSQVALARPLYDTVVYMNGRFQCCWADFGGYKGKAAIENDFYDAIMNGASTCLGDHLHPNGMPEADIYRDLKEIYAKIEAYEPWTDGTRFQPEIAVLSTVPKLNQSHYGVGRILGELNYAFDILMPDGDFSKYPVLILPDEITVSGELREKLNIYLKQGGKILSTGTSGLMPDGSGFALPQWDFAYKGKDPMQIAYYKPTFEEKDLIHLPWECYEPGILLDASEEDTVFARHITTYFNPGYDGTHFNFYMPPKGETGHVAAVMNRGKNVIQVSFPLFKAYMKTFTKAHRILMKHLLAELIPQKQILTEDLPITARATLTKGEDYTLLHVKATYPEIRGTMGVIEEHNVLPAGRTVAVKGEFSSACLLPDGTPLVIADCAGYTKITLPEITGYAMICLK
ncbi:MAG: beta-galactosidase trimerization domain-containing protein [Clostridia bacterium]|nr:beta-galactosidase trimerization domain-containing protein [Clostridia bacterium]